MCTFSCTFIWPFDLLFFATIFSILYLTIWAVFDLAFEGDIHWISGWHYLNLWWSISSKKALHLLWRFEVIYMDLMALLLSKWLRGEYRRSSFKKLFDTIMLFCISADSFPKSFTKHTLNDLTSYELTKYCFVFSWKCFLKNIFIKWDLCQWGIHVYIYIYIYLHTYLTYLKYLINTITPWPQLKHHKSTKPQGTTLWVWRLIIR